VQDCPNSPWVNKAKLGISRSEVLADVTSQKNDRAKRALDKLVSDFSKHPDLAESLFWIAARYRWSDRFGDEKSVYNRIVKNDPNGPFSVRAKLNIARADIMSLIIAKDFDKAKKALDNLYSEYSGQSDLPESLYWIAEKYEWLNKYEEAKQIYAKIIKDHSDSPYANKAKLGIARAEVMSSIMEQNYKLSGEQLEKLIADFGGHPDLAESLSWIGQRYEWMNQNDEAKRLSQKISQISPAKQVVKKAEVNIRKSEVMSSISSQDYESAEKALDKMILDSNGNPELPYAVFLIGERYLKDTKVPDHKQKALRVFEKVMNDIPRNADNRNMYAELYYCAGLCYSDLNDYPKALNCYETIVSEHQNFVYAWYAQFMVGNVCQTMKEKGLVDAKDADKKTKSAYEELLKKYPACDKAPVARAWLKRNHK
jgi:tetratricopeptide (TPR) repeat protein